MRQPDLMMVHHALKSTLTDADVFWNFNGANVHPSWLQEFDCLNVYCCFDDPEASVDISKPVAPYADACLIGNLSCGPLYESWGVREHAWAPLAFIGDDFKPELSPEAVLSQVRPIDLIFFGEREAPYRRERLDLLAHTFPDALFRGSGWPEGYVSAEQRRKEYSQAKIGWNLHNSVGPVNLRFFSLLANGVLQICDNKCRIGQILKLNEEILGFDTMEECIDLTRYYLKNDDERRRIAANGLKRYQEEFTEKKIWEYYVNIFRTWIDNKNQLKKMTPIYAPATKRKHFSMELDRIGKVGQSIADRFGYEIRRKPVSGEKIPLNQSPYVENPETGGINFDEKEKRTSEGGFFEWPNMVALNWACAKLAGSAREILDIGGGTGCFAFEASAVPDRRIVCVDLDKKAIEWAQDHRPRPNIEYVAGDIPGEKGPFDLVVAVDVIEHVADFSSFLRTCCSLAPRAIITTPNKAREADRVAGPPSYHQHVREWTPGEAYWVLRCFYEEVELYSMPNVFVPELIRIGIDSELTPIVAYCTNPLFEKISREG